MASPQLENGYAKVANQLIEQFAKINLSPYESRILWAIIRKTYGWNRAGDHISVTQLEELTQIDRRNISRAKKSLVSKNIVLITEDGIKINKHFDTWLLSSAETQPTIVSRDTPKVSSVQTHPVVSRDTPSSSAETQKLSSAETPQYKGKNSFKDTKQKKGTAGGKTTPCWQAYSDAYERRYKVPPVRNATVNGQLANFIKRVGQEEAPHIAAYYLRHNEHFYVKKMHPIGVMLADAEKLRTEWATNRQVTNAQASQADKTQTNFSVFDKIRQEILDDESKLA